MTSYMWLSRAWDNPPVLIACSLRPVSSDLDGRLSLFRRLATDPLELEPAGRNLLCPKETSQDLVEEAATPRTPPPISPPWRPAWAIVLNRVPRSRSPLQAPLAILLVS